MLLLWEHVERVQESKLASVLWQTPQMGQLSSPLYTLPTSRSVTDPGAWWLRPPVCTPTTGLRVGFSFSSKEPLSFSVWSLDMISS